MTEAEDDDIRRGFRVPPELLMLVFLAALLCFAAGVVEDKADSELPAFHKGRDSNHALSISIWLMGGGILLWAISAPPGRPPRPATAKPRYPLCAHCFTPYIDGAHFCPTCGRPQTFFAGTGGYETVYAEAWCLGKAANHPTSLLHVWTLTAYAASVGLSVIAILLWHGGTWLVGFDQDLQSDSALAESLSGILWSVHAYVWVSLAVRSWSRWNARQRGDEDVPPESSYGVTPYWTHDADWKAPDAPAYDERDDFLPEPEPDADEPPT